jgi:ribonuclease T2
MGASILSLGSRGWLALIGASSLIFSLVDASSVSCAANAPLSCHNTTAYDTCCFNFPGGDLLQTQFWDTKPATGPSNSWTIHGLWCVSPFYQWNLTNTIQAGPLYEFSSS